MHWRKLWLGRLGIASLVIIVVIAGPIAFGLSRHDAARLRAFGDAVGRWQHNPDFRAVQREYVILGVDAMQMHLCGASAARILMAFRSLPGLPASLAVNETSAAHYRAFSRGELSAYLHLMREQGVSDGVAMVEGLAARRPLADQQVVDFLHGFKMPVPIATDPGAIASVRQLVQDVMPTTRPLAIRDNPADRLTPPELDAMDRAAQLRAFAGLDNRVRQSDAELWRTKQVADFLAGIWAQGYGQIYLDGIAWLFAMQRWARVVFACALAGAVAVLVARRKSAAKISRPDSVQSA